PAINAATVVPWPTGSTRPSPSSTKSFPGSTWPARSACVASTPESRTATMTPSPFAYRHASVAFSSRSCHCSSRTMSIRIGVPGTGSAAGGRAGTRGATAATLSSAAPKAVATALRACGCVVTLWPAHRDRESDPRGYRASESEGATQDVRCGQRGRSARQVRELHQPDTLLSGDQAATARGHRLRSHVADQRAFVLVTGHDQT